MHCLTYVFGLSVIAVTTAFFHSNNGNIAMPMKRQSQGSFVAFSAAVETSILSPRGPLRLETVITNYGDGYNNRTGVFTCPRSGVYVFNVHGINEENHHFAVDLYKNSEYQASVYCFIKYEYFSGANSIILDLNQHDTVYIKTPTPDYRIYADDGRYVTFSGFLLIPK